MGATINVGVQEGGRRTLAVNAEASTFPTVRTRDIAFRCAQVLAELERLCAAMSAPAEGAAWADECVVCFAALRDMRLQPCCHALLCPPCAAELVRRGGDCPVCRAAVERYEEGAVDATYAPA